MNHITISSQQQSCFCCHPVIENNDSDGQPENGKSPSHNSTLLAGRESVDSQTDFHQSIEIGCGNSEANFITDLISDFHIDHDGIMSSSHHSAHSHMNTQEQLDNTQIRLNLQTLNSRELGVSLRNGKRLNYIPGMSALCTKPKTSDITAENLSGSDLDLDFALNELGMLSTVTNSRREYLLESRARTSASQRTDRTRKLEKKSQSSPNLASLSRMNGFRILHLDNKYVTNVSCDKSVNSPYSCGPLPDSADGPAIVSQSPRSVYRDPQLIETMTAAHRRRSFPRMSRMRKNRYNHMRLPYQIPKRLCDSMQEMNLEASYSLNANFRPLSFPESKTQVSSSTQQMPLCHSRSNTNSPAKADRQDLTRSHSVEDLVTIQKRLELVLDGSNSKETEKQFDQIATQLTYLHMT